MILTLRALRHMGRVEWVTDQVRERKSMVGEGVVVVVGEGEYLEGWWRVMGDIFGELDDDAGGNDAVRCEMRMVVME